MSAFSEADDACRFAFQATDWQGLNPQYVGAERFEVFDPSTKPHRCMILETGATKPRQFAFLSGNYYCPPNTESFSQGLCVLKGLDPDKAKQKLCGEGNPIEPTSANKLQIEADHLDPHAGRLSFIRYYSSFGSEEGNRLGATSATDLSRWYVFSGTPSFSGSVARNDRDQHIVDTVWSHNFSRYLNIATYEDGRLVNALRPGGGHIQFIVKNIGVTQDADVNDRLIPMRTTAGVISGWRIQTADNTVETYDNDGYLETIAYSDGYTQYLTYNDAAQIGRISDSYGRALDLAYVNGRLASVTPNKVSATHYLYNSQNILQQVIYPDSTDRMYLFDERDYSSATEVKHLLTGIRDENGQRFATFYFDGDGRAYRTEHAGGAERIVIDGKRAADGTLTGLSVTDSLGSVRNYNHRIIHGVYHQTSVSQPGGSGCNAASSAISYDANGNVSQRRDFVGNITQYDNYDLSRNLEQHRIEGIAGYGSANALHVSTQWHPFWRLKTRVAEPKRITTWVYNGQPDPSNGNAILRCAPAEAKVVGEPIAVICKRIEQATTDETGAQGFAATASGKPRVWAYTYNAFGQVLRENGPRTDVADTTTYTYYTDTVFNAAGEGHTIGDLSKITNAVGHVTKFTLYDRAGRLLRRLEANGAETRYAYTPRGWLKAEVLRYQGQERFTSYTYDKVGQLTQVIAPNDYVMDFSYDAAHRLTGLRDSLGNRIQYTLDGAGNRLLEDVTDAGGVLVQRTNRVFDQLGRLQNVKVQAP
jgi:YD repeat-containing protein